MHYQQANQTACKSTCDGLQGCIGWDTYFDRCEFKSDIQMMIQNEKYTSFILDSRSRDEYTAIESFVGKYSALFRIPYKTCHVACSMVQRYLISQWLKI